MDAHRLPLDIGTALGSDAPMSGPAPQPPAISPSEGAAEAAVRATLGWSAPNARRFTTGLAFYVYEVRQGANSVVVRMGLPAQSGTMTESLTLWRRLAPLGVPLPQIIADGTAQPLPLVIMSRLPGTDLGHVVHTLSSGALTGIAHAVADAQLATISLGPGTSYGFAARPEAAPHASWSAVVAAGINRSMRRIAANGLFPVEIASPVLERFAVHRPALDAMPPTPFLHDTTTKNVIVTESGTFSGIVDVDDLCFGDPRYAVALTKAALLAFCAGPVDYVEPWMARMGLKDDAVFAFYVAAFLLDFMSEHGMVFNGNQPPSDPATREHLAQLLRRVLGKPS